ncbi:glycosyltransferase 87 family protein [Streptomyces flavofungini]|uniref:glycosyltransferase 87 family protein n=1 Tax=Streptomyces flavofungini TaxID=68200 RepID=UPI0025B1C4B7|nr:glycosyltransferase 87 family protein [Streptomyces flavofungini]WJV46010.1 glycosyltransferase 87 family protein [Streptomyces flavofungini]
MGLRQAGWGTGRARTGPRGGEGRRGLALAVPLGGVVLLAASLIAWWYVVTDPAYTGARSPADLSVYLDAADAPDQGLYEGKYGIHGLPYLYPPFALLPFRAFAGADLTVAVRVMAGVSVVAMVLVAWAAVRVGAGARAEPRAAGETVARAGIRWSAGPVAAGCACAVTGVALWTEPVLQNLDFGQVNLVLLALVVTDLATADRRPWKGLGVGIAAGLKLTPGLFVVYLLLTRRFRAAGVATAAFAGTVLGGWLALPKASADFWGGALAGSPGGRDYLANQSLNGVFVRLGFGGDGVGGPVWGAACGLLVVAGLAAAAVASRRGRELVAICVVGALTLLCSPLSWTHHWVWIVPALVLAADAAARRATARAWLWVAGLFALFAAWPIRIDGFGTWDPARPLLPYGLLWYTPHWHREQDWDPFHFLSGNFYVWVGLGFVVWAVWAFGGWGRAVRPGGGARAARTVRGAPGARDAGAGAGASVPGPGGGGEVGVAAEVREGVAAEQGGGRGTS